MLKFNEFIILTISSILFPFLFFTLPLTHAQEKADTESPAEVVNSFDLFWPLVPGKTESDSLYSLKLFKEKVQGWLIFGDTKKADYAVLLGTKRVLEAEKLLKESKTELALNTLTRAETSYSNAYFYMKSAHEKGKFSAKEVRKDRLINVKRLADYLKITSVEEVDKRLESVKDKVNLILGDYIS